MIILQTGKLFTWQVYIPFFLRTNFIGADNLAEEHQIDIFDKASFFSLHDFDGNDYWDRSEVLKTYGMDDPSAKDVPETKKNEIIRVIHELMDKNADNLIDKSEYLAYQGSLPDFGLGSGHHWDMETEYEIHHWRKWVENPPLSRTSLCQQVP